MANKLYSIWDYDFDFDRILDDLKRSRGERPTADQHMLIDRVFRRDTGKATKDELIALCELERLALESKLAIIEKLD
jgi:hypothetical protein